MAWTDEQRRIARERKEVRQHLGYNSDLSDAEWERVRPHIPPQRCLNGNRRVDMRRVVDAILYVNWTGIMAAGADEIDRLRLEVDASRRMPGPDRVTALARLQAEVDRLASDINSLAECRNISEVRRHAPPLVERLRSSSLTSAAAEGRNG